MTDARERLERAFVATSYLVGRRGDELTSALPAPSLQARKLAAKLGHAERNVRAQVLASELAPIVQALDAWRYR